MANLTTTGNTGYPGALDSVTTLVDGAAGDQILARHPNGLGAAVVALETELGTDPAGTMTDVKTRLAVALNDDGTVKSTVVTAGGGASVAYSTGVFTVGWSPDGPGYVQNLGIEVTANSPVANAMRIRLVQRSGATPTSASPIRLAMKVATVSASPALGAYVVREITGETNVQISSGSSLGTFVNETARLYIGALDSNGTIEAIVYNPKEIQIASTTAARVLQLFRPSEVATYTTVAEGGAGGADSAATIYSTTARTGAVIRRLGYVDVTVGSSVGNWSNNPNGLTIIGPGVPVTGDVIQRVSTSTGIVKTGTTAVPHDGTIPQITEGDPYIWATMTHSCPANPVQIETLIHHANSNAGARLVQHLHRNSEVNAQLVGVQWSDNVGVQQSYSISGMLATTNSVATGYYVLLGAAAGTNTMNGEGGGSTYGQSNTTHLTVQEICA